jgi:hypothetical protein
VDGHQLLLSGTTQVDCLVQLALKVITVITDNIDGFQYELYMAVKGSPGHGGGGGCWPHSLWVGGGGGWGGGL